MAGQKPTGPAARKTPVIRTVVVRLKPSSTRSVEPALTPRRWASCRGTAASTGAADPVPTRTVGSAVKAPAGASAVPAGQWPETSRPNLPPSCTATGCRPLPPGPRGAPAFPSTRVTETAEVPSSPT